MIGLGHPESVRVTTIIEQSPFYPKSVAVIVNEDLETQVKERSQPNRASIPNRGGAKFM
jgi:hypothetical protein